VIQIRPASAADLPALAVLHQAALGGPGEQATLAHLRALALVYFAAKSDQFLGVATGQLAADEFEIHAVAVAEAARGQGLGHRLVRALEQGAREAGAAAAFLEVRAGNTAARALYTGLGYTEFGRRPTYYRDGDEAVLMRRDLREPPCGA